MVRFNNRSAAHHGERGVDDRRLQLDEHLRAREVAARLQVPGHVGVLKLV